MSSSARRVNTPSPTPNAGDSAPVSSPRNAECAATPTLGKEEEEEEEEKEERETTATVIHSSAPSTKSRDTTNYQEMLKPEGQAIGEVVKTSLLKRGVKSDSESSKSIDQYMRHVWRFLHYCEETAEQNEKRIYFISRQMFENYLDWYEAKTNRRQNDYKHVGVALGHVVRCFLQLDDEKISESGVEDESEMYFRSSDGLSREDAKNIAALAGKDVQSNDGFWLNGGKGKSLLSKKKTAVRLGKVKARNDGVTATTQGTAVDAIIEEDVFYGAANVGPRSRSVRRLRRRHLD